MWDRKAGETKGDSEDINIRVVLELLSSKWVNLTSVCPRMNNISMFLVSEQCHG